MWLTILFIVKQNLVASQYKLFEMMLHSKRESDLTVSVRANNANIIMPWFVFYFIDDIKRVRWGECIHLFASKTMNLLIIIVDPFCLIVLSGFKGLLFKYS